MSRIRFASWMILVGLTSPFKLFPQVGMHPTAEGSSVRLLENDAAILDSGEPRKDLPCNVTPVKPVMGFDLRFHSGYDITIPLRELAGQGDTLTIIFRVTSDLARDTPAYFSQKYNVPDIEENASGDAYLGGGFDVGEGDYHVDWLMRDRIERICASSWDTSAALSAKDQTVKLAISPHAIETSDQEFFRAEPLVRRADTSDSSLKVKVLLNFAPQVGYAASMTPVDTSALVSILRNIARDPRICRFSLVAFNLNEQRIVYRQEDTDQIDFPSLGKALNSLKLGVVDYKHLADPHSESEFLANLITSELTSNDADAVIFAGPKVTMTESIPMDSRKDLAAVSFPVFYLNYNLSPQQNPWRDPIGNLVKHMRGYEYTITRPRDLWTSWSDIVARIAKLKLVTVEATSSVQ